MADGALPIDRVRSATHHGRFFADDDEFSVLTPYEQRRTAHAKRDDPARRRVLYRELMVHVTCPICLEPLTCTRTTKEVGQRPRGHEVF